jgi:hypothetical protein
MSNTGQKDRAYPRSIHEKRGAYILGASCAGGKGGGAFFVYVGSDMKVIEYRVTKFDVYNRKLILRNPNFDVFADGGDNPSDPDPQYRLAGERQNWYLGFGVNSALTGPQIIAQNILITIASPCEIEVDAIDLPQPTDAGWDNRIYIYMYWGNPNFVISTRSSINLDVIKHDYDIKI